MTIPLAIYSQKFLPFTLLLPPWPRCYVKFAGRYYLYSGDFAITNHSGVITIPLWSLRDSSIGITAPFSECQQAAPEQVEAINYFLSLNLNH